MGFICPECKKDFGTDEQAMRKHMEEHKGSHWNSFVTAFLTPRQTKKQRKPTANLSAVEQAVKDGRLVFGMTFDGEGYLKNTRTGTRISLGCPGIYEGAVEENDSDMRGERRDDGF